MKCTQWKDHVACKIVCFRHQRFGFKIQLISVFMVLIILRILLKTYCKMFPSPTMILRLFLDNGHNFQDQDPKCLLISSTTGFHCYVSLKISISKPFLLLFFAIWNLTLFWTWNEPYHKIESLPMSLGNRAIFWGYNQFKRNYKVH